jgi:23S rRNA (cytidine2498-2'-O)-methyltransferase
MTKIMVFFDKRFVRQVIQELKLMLDMDYSIERYISDSIIVVNSGKDYGDIKKSLESSSPIFIDRILELNAIVDVANGYSELENALDSLAKSYDSGPLKIEVLKERSSDERHAKEIEIELGRALESKGDITDLANPHVILYALLNDGKAYVSAESFVDKYSASLDRFRSRNIESDLVENKVSRAEFKLYEAVNYFKIELSSDMKALDIGAAPGGWTRYLLRNKLKVVAIDAGSINYKAMPEGTKIAVVPGNGRSIEGIEGIDVLSTGDLTGKSLDYDLLHIKELFDRIKLSELIGLGPFDILCIDINIPAQEAAVIAAVCADVLKPKGKLILTLKMTDDNVEKNIESSKQALGATYEGIKVKKLPHDRKELTLFAIKL